MAASVPTDGVGLVLQERRKHVDAARVVWIARLVDTSRRNNLLYFRDLQVGTLDLTSAEPSLIDRLFAGEKVQLSKLVPQSVDPKAGAKMREIARKAQANLEEKGLQTLFLAYGMATWPADDEGRPPESAVVLLPVVAEGRRADTDSIALIASGQPQSNISLLHALSEEHGVPITEEDLFADSFSEDEVFDREAVLANLRKLAGGVREFDVRSRVVLGNFSFQKLAMVKDLQQEGEALAGHDLVAALAGDLGARDCVGGRCVGIEPRALDQVPAESEFIILDADSSQQVVVHAAESGASGVIQGPPGCGKSQTIANVISTLVARGKRVLFVAEKRAALEAVYKRLEERGLGHIALDLHGAAVSQKTVLEKVALARDRIRHSADPKDEEIHRRFEERRTRLVAHERAINTPQDGSGLTPYELQAGIILTAQEAVSSTRWRASGLTRLHGSSRERVRDLLSEASGFAGIIARTSTSPWAKARLDSEEQSQAALDAVRRLSHTCMRDLIDHLAPLSEQIKFKPAASLQESTELLALLTETNDLLAAWRSSMFEDATLAMDLSPAGKSFLAVIWATLTSPTFRTAKRRAAGHSMKCETEPRRMLEAAIRCRSVADRWSGWATVPSSPQRLELVSAIEALDRFRESVDVLTPCLTGFELLRFDQMEERLLALLGDEGTARTIPSARQIEAEIESLGAGSILAELRARSTPQHKWAALFDNAYYSSCYDAARLLAPELASFRGETHDTFAEEFRSLDIARLDVAASRVRRAHAERAIRVMNEFPEQELLVRAEIAKSKRHIPLRRLVSQASEVLTAICPCWMSSPLNVSQLLPSDRRYFDAVVFDEASQILPEDAISSLLRGDQTVVAGDRHQLPPTVFFADGAEEEDEDAPTTGYESLLDQMSAFADHWQLAWHYRSQDERLIAFSNRHIYGDRLTTFPGVGASRTIEHILVDSENRDGEEDTSSAEVLKVVELVLRHAEEQIQRPEADRESLGVIAFGIRHADRVQAALDRAIDSKRSLADFLDTSKNNPWFFLKNLERVQGDERDAIILSVGYSKDASGKLPYRFGPLLREGGERRLNVAISRAKRRMIVVSSFSHSDMDPRRSDRRGVELLRLFLQFAKSGGRNLGDAGGTGEPMNGFEADVHDALATQGIPLVPQYGCSNYRLDFAALHPSRPGEFVLAIECDGASYHSAPTARDRDRLRQQQLEAIGWRFHRIWSTDWFLHRNEQITRAISAWNSAVKDADDRRNRSLGLGGLFASEKPAKRAPHAPDGIAAGPRDPRPWIHQYGDIDSYTLHELVSYVRWVKSDGLLRTDEEIVSELVPLLGFRRRGPRIRAALMDAIEASRGSP